MAITSPSLSVTAGLAASPSSSAPSALSHPSPTAAIGPLGTCPAFAFQERREREQQDLEFAKEMAEDDDDGFP